MKKILPLVLMLITGTLQAQQDPLFSQYMFNKLAVNPAYAGSRDALTVDAIYRYQWVSMSGGPQTFSASVHAPLVNPHIGLGFNMYNDVIGATVNQGALATFAYRLIFPESKLSFGVQAGVKYSDILWSRINPYDTEDPLYRAEMRNKAVADANFGIYYYSSRYYLGLSSKQLLQNQMGIVTINGKDQFTKLLRHFYGMAGAALPISDEIVFRPSILAKFVQNAPPQIDLNLSLLFAEKIWIGASYRSEKAVSFMTEFNVSRKMRIGYAYDIWFNELQAYNKGSHEIRLGFDFDLFRSRMMTPRYF
ncbi:MAG: type IX secretion system membrane protein PorP/SprF [Bacteroidales bacterium]|nr:type IX secretion system membrane protein PorP/SprF [Bacteroidales bacterium]